MSKKKPSAIAITVAAVTWLSAAAGAQPIYRCGNNYSQTPCVGGSVVQAEDARTADQKAQSDAVTKRDAQMAATLEKDREKLQSKAVAGYIPAAKAAEPVAAENKKSSGKKVKKKKMPEYFTAVAPLKPGEKPAAGKKATKSRKPG